MDSAAAQDTGARHHGLQSDKWQRISPTSIIYFVMKFVRGLLQNGLQAIAPVAAVLATGGENRWFALSLLALAAALLMLVGAVLSYLNFKFRIDGEAFLIRSGVLTRKRLTLTFDRIQNVAFREPIYFRPFGLVVLALESAGSKSEEVNLAGIPRPLAEDIRRYVLEHKKQLRRKTEDQPAATAAPETEEKTGVIDLLRQPISELVRYGVSNNNIWVFAGIIAGTFGQFDRLWESSFFGTVADTVGETVGSSLFAISATLLFAVLMVLLILMAASVLGAIFVNYNYHLTYHDDRYHRTRGLLERQETSVPEVKIQSLKISQPLIAKLLNRFHLTFNQVGFDKKDGTNKQQKFVVPSVKQDFYQALVKRLFENTTVLDRPLTGISKKFIARHVLYTLGVPAVLITVFLTSQIGWSGLFSLTIPVLLTPLVILRKQRYGYASDDRYAVIRQGFFGQTLTVIPFYKVQTVKISQSPGQRAAGLANLKIKLAGHSLTIPYMPLETARRWRAGVFAEIQNRRDAWM